MEQPYSLHSYAYGYSNPVGNTDPSGQCVPGFDQGCEFIGWENLRNGNLNWSDGRAYSAMVGETAYNSVVDPFALLYDVATHPAAGAMVVRGAQVLRDEPLGSAAFIGRVGITPFTDIYEGITCGNSTQLGRGLTSYAFLLGGARLARKPVTDIAQTPTVDQLSPRLQRDIIPDGGGSVDIHNAPYTVARLIRSQDWVVWGTDARVGDFIYLGQSRTVQEALSRIPRSW
jgi:hypothetical protein